jgi:hypothetical protein
VYDGGYLGLAPDTNLERVFVRLEGTMDHVINMTLIEYDLQSYAGNAISLHDQMVLVERLYERSHIFATLQTESQSFH